ncbi:hypothetical protein [Dictyobacter kobayashii]|uniref:Uncharacterized protein n=1 Tax=Dictyobacter kobayashii TaxID=2014872 RepID=A0A402AVV0_9CHLR|nr:hypothetical protein [Dictyobacter kobayashii]GCE23251.1 hypothetical protein KDK_70510 [Dictyobacter kobayashii]
MTLQRFPTLHDYAERAASFERQLQSLERRRDTILAQIEQCKSPAHQLVSLLAPLYRRSMIFEVRQLRKECERVEFQMQDLKAEYEAWKAEQKQRASELEENTRLYELETLIQREYRWLAVHDDQAELRKKQAVLEKVREQKRLQEEAQTLQREQKALQQQLSEVREKLGTNRQQRDALDDSHHTTRFHATDTQTADIDEAILKVSMFSK